MSTLDAKKVTNTNMDKFINDFDKVLQIESIKSRRDEVLENGTVAIWYTVSFKPFVNNLGKTVKLDDCDCILPMKILNSSKDDIKLSDKMINLTDRKYTLNQQLYLATYYRDCTDKKNYDVNNYIFIKPKYYERTQKCNRLNYDKYSKVGNMVEGKYCLLNLKRPESYDMLSLDYYTPKQQLMGNSNVTVTTVWLGKGIGYKGYERTKQLNLLNAGYYNKPLFETPDELYDKSKKYKYEVYRISGNKKNHSIANLAFDKYRDVTSSTRKKEGIVYYYINDITGDVSDDFNSMAELVDDFILRDVFGNKYSPLELDNYAYVCMKNNVALDDFIRIYEYQDEQKTKSNEIKYSGFKIWIITDVKTNKDFTTTEKDVAQTFVANRLDIVPESAGKYLRDVSNTGNLPDIRQKGETVFTVKVKTKDITPADIAKSGNERERLYARNCLFK